MFLERCQKLGGFTLCRKPIKKNKKTHATKETKHTANPRPHENELVSVMSILFNSLNFG